MRTSSVRETKNLCTHWPSLSAVFQSEATHSPVLWFRSLVSCPPAFCCGVFRPSVCLTWSVSEKLQSPGKFCRPPIMAAHKGPNPVLLIILSPLFLYLGWCTLDLDRSRKAHANMWRLQLGYWGMQTQSPSKEHAQKIQVGLDAFLVSLRWGGEHFLEEDDDQVQANRQFWRQLGLQFIKHAGTSGFSAWTPILRCCFSCMLHVTEATEHRARERASVVTLTVLWRSY